MLMTLKNEAHPNIMLLGVQTNVGKVEAVAKWKAQRWAPKKARSFTIVGIRHTDYHGRKMDHETGYADVSVKFFTTLKEGEHRLDVEYPH